MRWRVRWVVAAMGEAGSGGAPLTLGTAGHVDHGKTALVRALTGRNTDRLPEEKARGLSIELGYAHLRLAPGRAVSVVDVPGHERFVRTMVAGASGIDGFLMCVAADDGVMPQTREHLAVLRGLGIEEGVLAVTKCDLAEPTVALAEAVALTPGAECVAVSAPTGRGMEELRGALARLAERLPGRAPGDAGPAEPCLHVDRSFTVKGVGTVVTGTLWRGTVAAGDRVVVLPSGREARVRSVQVHDEPRRRAAAGQRVALNLAGLGRDEVGRGDVVTAPGAELAPSRTVDVELSLDDAEPLRAGPRGTGAGSASPGTGAGPGPHGTRSGGPMRDGTRVQVHHGTRECPARLVERPGGVWQLRLEQPLVSARGDRLILRAIAPPSTLGGAVVVDPHASRRHTPRSTRAPKGGVARNGTYRPASSQTPHEEPLSPAALVVEEELRAAWLEPPLDADLDETALAALRRAGRAVRAGPRHHFHADALAAARERIEELLARRGSLTVAELRDGLDTSRKFAQALLEHLDRERLTVRIGDRHELRGARRARRAGV